MHKIPQDTGKIPGRYLPQHQQILGILRPTVVGSLEVVWGVFLCRETVWPASAPKSHPGPDCLARFDQRNLAGHQCRAGVLDQLSKQGDHLPWHQLELLVVGGGVQEGARRFCLTGWPNTVTLLAALLQGKGCVRTSDPPVIHLGFLADASQREETPRRLPRTKKPSDGHKG